LHRDGTRAVYLIGLLVLAGALPFSVRTLTDKKPVLFVLLHTVCGKKSCNDEEGKAFAETR
jgi:hypothetical protein